MAQIKHITAADITDATALYVDGKIGTVISVDHNDSTETTFVTFEDPNGERTIQLGDGETVATLVG